MVTLLENNAGLASLFNSLTDLFTVSGLKMVVMWIIGGILIYLAIKKEMEPTLLLPIGFGAILMNFPGVVTRLCTVEGCTAAIKFGDKLCPQHYTPITVEYSGIAEPLHELYNAGIANELFPLLLFIGIGAMIDFGPLLNNPKLMLFGAAAQFGIFFTLCAASIFFPEAKDFASISIICGDGDGNASRLGGVSVAVDNGVCDRLGDGALDVGDLGDPGVQLGHEGRHRRPRHGLVHRQGGEFDLDLIEDLSRELCGSTGTAHAFFSFLGSVS